MSDQNEPNPFDEYQPDDAYSSEPPAEEAAGEEAAGAPKPGNNRNFLIAIGIIGGVFLIALIAMAIVASMILPQQAATRATQAALVLVNNQGTAAAATALALVDQQAQIPTGTPPPTATNTVPPPTNTPVLVAATATTGVTAEPHSADTAAPTAVNPGGKAETPGPNATLTTPAPGGTTVAQAATLSPGQARTATLAVLLTQVAGQRAQGAATGATPTALPSTGFADEVGLPGLFGLALALVALIFIARGLRMSTR